MNNLKIYDENHAEKSRDAGAQRGSFGNHEEEKVPILRKNGANKMAFDDRNYEEHQTQNEESELFKSATEVTVADDQLQGQLNEVYARNAANQLNRES